MTSFHFPHLVCLGAACLLSSVPFANTAWAQEARTPANPGGPEPSQPSPGGDELHPPRLLEFVQAEYPPAARAQGRSAHVGLRITLDATGKVTEVEVVEPAGHGFDEAARAAAERFSFAPARRGNTRIAARVPYSYAFEPEPLAAAARVPPGSEGAIAPQASPAASVALEAAPGETAMEVTISGAPRGRQLEQSAQAVRVVDTEQAQRQSSDLGQVLARTEGVAVRRSGGLGSEERFSLNGLTGDQIRFFLDGLPLELSGYPFGIANVPVNLVERAEIYRGVVPIRFGADALGGAVNLVSDEDIDGTHGSAAYQTGAFGTHRLSLAARHLDEPSGVFVRLDGFADHADNDYPVDVEVPDERGRLSPARVYRFHDAYDARGAHLELGLVDRPWGKRLILRAFVTDYDKELQHDAVMTIPYGEVRYGETSLGGSLHYAQTFARMLSLDVVGGYTHGRQTFVDASRCVYSWFGQCVRARVEAGEIQSPPRDQLLIDQNAFGRINADIVLHPQHIVRVSSSPTFTTRTGDERLQADPMARDPLTARRDVFSWVNGLEYQLDLLDDRLENIAFVKQYVQVARSEETVAGGLIRDRNRDTDRFGFGDAFRFRFLDGLYAKASYEWATRLPRPDELFGDGVLVLANLQLEPEVSHNLNLGVTLDSGPTTSGAWQGELNGFSRNADQLIVLIGSNRASSYQNVFAAHSKGLEAAARWTAPGEFLGLGGNVTYQSFRNTSDQGAFGAYEGDRIPNQPYFFANASARLAHRGVAAANDELSLDYDLHFVHEFYRGWESIGRPEFKQTIDSQLTHTLALTYLVRGEPVTLSFSAEVQNLTDEDVYDAFGVQRPGRAAYFKVSAEL